MSVTSQMNHSSNKILLSNVIDSTGTKFNTSGHSLKDSPHTQDRELVLVTNTHLNSTKESIATSSKDVPKHMPTEKQSSTAATHQKRNSWLSNLSNLSLKFTSTTSTFMNTPGKTESPTPLSPGSLKYAVLAQAQKPVGEEPYIPALPRTSHPSFLQNAFRRLSSSNNLVSQGQIKVHHENGICERKILNVDKNRNRCKIEGLNPAKLRRVAFCVDIQVMEDLKYHEVRKEEEKTTENEDCSVIPNQTESTNGITNITRENIVTDEKVLDNESDAGYFSATRKFSRKKEKKRRNEKERKTKKEKKKKLAEAHGQVPLEVTINHSVASLGTSASSLNQEKSITFDPLRIYKRCCLLRETSVVKRIAEQLADSKNHNRPPGVMNRMDLTGHHLTMSDTITLSDFLAIYPVNDLVMENCGLTDESVRIIFAALLSTQHPDIDCHNSNTQKTRSTRKGGFVTRVVLKNNPRIGKDGWQYICTFIALCRSLKSMDLSEIKIPQPSHHDSINPNNSENNKDLGANEVSRMLGSALCGRQESCELKLLNMADCGLSSDQIRNLIDGLIHAGLCRLGLARNNIQPEGLQYIGRYLRNCYCEGLDLSGNDLRDHLEIIADSLAPKSSLHSLSLAKSNLSPDSILCLFRVLVNHKNFKFINLSNNPQLFCTEPSAIPVFRRYLPQLKALKKMNLMSVSLTSDQAIALAEILPEMPSLAHVNIMENPLQDVLNISNGRHENKEEEACALFTSLMAAVRVSKTIVCVDIEIPSPESSEVVKALAKQVFTYCLWNMEHASVAPVAEINESDSMKGEKNVDVPDILLHLLDDDDEDVSPRSLEITEPTLSDEDYVISGTGVVKALSVCLSNLGDDSRQDSSPDSNLSNFSATMKVDHAKKMSKNLLNTARSVRSRLQIIVKESRVEDASSYQRLITLDQTLEGLIKRFEDEFAEMRFPKRMSSHSLQSDISQFSGSNAYQRPDSQNFSEHSVCSETSLSDDETSFVRPTVSRQNSDLLVAGRALGKEEGRMLRLSKKFEKNDLKADNGSHEEKKLVLDWIAPLDNCANIFDGGLGIEEGLLKQSLISSDIKG